MTTTTTPCSAAALYRNEIRDRATNVRIIQRFNPSLDPYRIGVYPPDPARVRRLNVRHVAILDGTDILIVANKIGDAIAAARAANKASGGDFARVEVVLLDEQTASGQFVHQAARDWLAERGQSLEGPPLAPPRPEDAPEALAARKSVQVFRAHVDPPGISLGIDESLFCFVERVAVTGEPPAMQFGLEIVHCTRSLLDAQIKANAMNQANPADRPFCVRQVSMRHFPSSGESPYRIFLDAQHALQKKRELAAAGK